jgi:hypothetical protein
VSSTTPVLDSIVANPGPSTAAQIAALRELQQSLRKVGDLRCVPTMASPAWNGVVDAVAEALDPDDESGNALAHLERAVDEKIVLVPPETNATTLTALAQFYEGRRDKFMAQLAGVLETYGTEVNKRDHFPAGMASGLLKEARQWLDRADKEQAQAMAYRDLLGKAR